jgi:type II secretory pathway predicted ATPase ExeA
MGMSELYPHLHASARSLAEDTTELRIRRIRTDRWIAYARAEAALSAMEDLLSFPKRLRMPNLMLVGPTNNGKTMVVDKFRRDHPPTEARASRDGVADVPVLKVQMPCAPDERRFFGAIVDALGMPDRANDRIAAKQDAAIRLMRATKVRLLVIDEMHNVLSGSRNQQRRFLNLMRWLGNELQIPLVAVGTAEALRAIQSDEQLANRFEPFELPPWSDGEEYRRLLSTLEATMPLRRPSRLAEPAMAGTILSAAEGILGEIVAVITRAAAQAVNTGAEAVSAETIDATGFIPPSKRRRVGV